MQILLPCRETLLMPDASGSLFISPIVTPLPGWAVPCSAHGWHAAQSSSAGALPAAEPRPLAHCRGRDSASPTPQQQCGSCFQSAPTDCTARVSHPSLVVWALTLEKGDWGFGSRLVLEMLGLAAPEGTPADGVGASPALSMRSRRRQLKSCWDKGWNEGVWFGRICSRVLERSPGCWSLLQLLKHFTWKTYWITSHSRNSPWSWDENSWEGARARLLQKTTVGKGERGACRLMLLLLLSHPTGTPVVHTLHTQKTGSATKSFFPACFTVLFWGYFCELIDPGHSCAREQHSQTTPEGSKPHPGSGSPGQWFPKEQQWGWTSHGLFLQPHGEEDRGNDPSENESSYRQRGLGVHPPGERAGKA